MTRTKEVNHGWKCEMRGKDEEVVSVVKETKNICIVED